MPRVLRLFAFFACLLPGLAVAQKPALQHTQWSATVSPAALAPGETGTLAVEVAIAEGWKLYALDTPPPSPALRLSAEGKGVRVGAFAQQPPQTEDDPNLGVQVRLFREAARFTAPIAVEAGAEGMTPIGVQILFTICDKRICLPPTRHTVEAAVEVAPRADAQEVPGRGADSPSALSAAPAETLPAFGPPADSVAGESGQDEAEAAPAGGFSPARADAGGMGGFLLVAFLAGLAALLTPCVFPMIPLTVSYFTRHTETRGEAVRMASLYGLSIVGTFTGLGLLLALLVGAAGAQQVAADPWVNLFIGAVFVLFGLSLLGLFELRLPSALVNRVGRGEQRGGALGVVFMGLTLTLVSFSCTVPFVGGLLAATVGGAWFYPAVGMLAFSSTFALPFFLFALFPRALGALPRAGAWMNAVKVTLGFVELAAALKFLSQADILLGVNVLSRPLVIAVTIVLFGLCGLYLLGKLALRDEPLPATMGVGRLLSAALFLGAALYLMPGLLGAPVGLFDAYLPPRRATDFSIVGASSPAAVEAGWHEGVVGLEAARREAEVVGKPVFVDFTGYTCTNCRYMEANVFTHPEVRARLERDFVLVRLYTDDPQEGEALSRYQLEQTGTVALPTYAVLDSAQRVLAQHSGTASAAEFAAFLDQGRDQALALRLDDGEEERRDRALLQDG